MSRRSGLVIGVVAVVVVALGAVVRQVLPGAATVTRPTAQGTNGVAAAVVNINGRLADGIIAGTGMILSADGTVLTNNHVVAGTDLLTAQVGGRGPVYDATVVGVDPTHDVAVIRLRGASGLPTVPLNRSGQLARGDHVTAMGNALGANRVPVSVTGEVTSLDESLLVLNHGTNLDTTLSGLIAFNAPIQPGDSGGPLIDQQGRVIGMDTAGSPSTGDVGSTFGAAIPINDALGIAAQITAGVTSAYIQSGHSGVLGVTVADADGGAGALVSTVVRGDAADIAGIVAGDVITEFGSTPIASAATFADASAGWRPGDHTTAVWRDAAGGLHRADVVLSEGPPA